LRARWFYGEKFFKKKLDFQKNCGIKKTGKILSHRVLSLNCEMRKRSGKCGLAGAFPFARKQIFKAKIFQKKA
jgi:hypothetical protein